VRSAGQYAALQNLKKFSLNAFDAIASLLPSGKDAFFLNSYLPKRTLFKLQVAYRQWPRVWRSPECVINQHPDLALRYGLGQRFASKASDSLERIARQFLIELLPVCYLEGMIDVKRSVSRLSWPRKPKFIFTSNSFDADEVFKLWTAEKVDSGICYYVGQHGNNYGTYRYMFPSIEESTSDMFLTWGWTDDCAGPNYAPAVLLKKAGKNLQRYNPRGGLLLIEFPLEHRTKTWDTTKEFIQYFEWQQSFVARLANSPRQNLLIRLHGSSRHLAWDEEARWLAFDPTLNIESGKVDINSLISESRLVVHSYDSTGILESLYANIPTLAFWQNGLEHLRDSAIPYYKLLIDVGILHLTVGSVASQVNRVWDCPDEWWKQDEIQDARRLFCEKYAMHSSEPVGKLLKIFNAN
jgi:putative transferase (TIGR04331 family)